MGTRGGDLLFLFVLIILPSQHQFKCFVSGFGRFHLKFPKTTDSLTITLKVVSTKRITTKRDKPKHFTVVDDDFVKTLVRNKLSKVREASAN